MMQKVEAMIIIVIGWRRPNTEQRGSHNHYIQLTQMKINNSLIESFTSNLEHLVDIRINYGLHGQNEG